MAHKHGEPDAKALNSWKEGLAKEALNIINNVLVERSNFMAEWLQQDIMRMNPSSIREPLRFSDGGIIDINKQLRTLTTRSEAEAKVMLRCIPPLRAWIKINVPPVETESNFAVEVLTKLTTFLGTAEAHAITGINRVVAYHTSRSTCSKQLCKYPNVDDNEEALYELDERMYTDLVIFTRDLWHNYTVLYDIFKKNMEWLEEANKSNMGLMY